MSEWKQYVAPNLGLLFYKKIYSDLIKKNPNILQIEEGKLVFKINEKTSEFDEFYKDFYDLTLNQYKSDLPVLGNTHFSLYTIYPGLLIGSGYTHNTKAKGDASIGFYFDHTTGLPVIPGSSVKGVLRSVFEIDVDDKLDSEYTGENSLRFFHFICDELKNMPENEGIIEKIEKLKNQVSNNEILDDLKQEIFGDTDEEGEDIFYDAFIDFNHGEGVKFMGSDFITPHIHEGLSYELSQLRDPTPLQFIKVLPGIGYKFSFKLKSNEYFDDDLKKIFYKYVLLTLGLGAKTNVGYGQFTDKVREKKVSKESNTEDGLKTKKDDGSGLPPPPFVEVIPDNIHGRLKSGSKFKGIITDIKNEYCYIEFKVGEKICKIRKKIDKINNPQKIAIEENATVEIVVNSDFIRGNSLNCKAIL